MIFSREQTPIFRTASLSLAGTSHTLRCDAKQAEKRFIDFEQMISSVEYFYLGDYLPETFVKGSQPKYIQSEDPSGIPVINTLSIQNLSINVNECRFITDEDFETLDESRKLKNNDVLLTVDGGTSIGKPVLFDLDDDFTVDSHVAILRPSGVDPRVIVYLLASPIGQLQFQKAESGASGQTAVTEEDIRRFRFPKVAVEDLAILVNELDGVRSEIQQEIEHLKQKENEAWEKFNLTLLKRASN